MRSSESLMNVEVAHVESGFPRPRYAQKRIGVGLVVEAQASNRMNCLYDLIGMDVVDTDILRIGHKDRGRMLVCSSLDRLIVRHAMLIRINGYDLEARRCRAGGITGMRKV